MKDNRFFMGILFLFIIVSIIGCGKKESDNTKDTSPEIAENRTETLGISALKEENNATLDTGKLDTVRENIRNREGLLRVGDGFVAVLMNNGTVWYKGDVCGEYSAQRGDVDPSAWSNIAYIADNKEFLCGINCDGAVVSACDLKQVIEKKIWAGAGSVAGMMAIDGLEAVQNASGVKDFVDSRCLLNNGEVIDKYHETTLPSEKQVYSLDGDNCLFADGTVYYGIDFQNEGAPTNWKEWKNVAQICRGMALDVDGKVLRLDETSDIGRSIQDCGKTIVMLASSYQVILGLCVEGTIIVEAIPGDDDFVLPDLSAWKNLVSVDAGVNCIAGLTEDSILIYTVWNEKERTWTETMVDLKGE